VRLSVGLVSASCSTPSSHSSLGKESRREAFATTHWSVVLLAGRNDTERAQAALARLCRTYWYPLYAYARRQNLAPAEAQDLTQTLFEQLIERQFLARADPARGRFRSFMLTVMKNLLAGDRRRARAQKRGGAQEIFSLDLSAAEQRYATEPADSASPDKLFDRQWALTLLDAVLGRLEQEHLSEGKAGSFAVLRETLMGAREAQPYAELAARLQWTEGAVKVAVHRLRKRYREMLRVEISQTVAGQADTDEEMRHLFASLSGD